MTPTMSRSLALPRAAVDRRSAPRIKVLVDVEVDPTCDGTYVFARGTAVNGDGIFVYTPRPEPVGTGLRLRLRDDEGPLEFEGVVMWANPPGPTVLDPGMGVRFVAARARERRRLMALVGRIAYLG